MKIYFPETHIGGGLYIRDACLDFPREPIPLNPDIVKYLFLHHIDAKTATPQQIHEWHLHNYTIVNGEKRYWNGGGYNFYVRKDCSIWALRGYHIGAQCHGHNSVSLGIAVEGDYEVETLPEDVKETVIALGAYLLEKYPGIKGDNILPHRAKQSTLCPGTNFPMRDIKDGILTERHWSDPYMDKIRAEGLIVGKHNPNDPVTWAEFSAVLTRLLDKKEDEI